MDKKLCLSLLNLKLLSSSEVSNIIGKAKRLEPFEGTLPGIVKL
ncbi:16182_t:CDS:2 [Acaulospora colombiana]|uniref:16182_t:CDS:1 n=1 Tax=Acaulospora colombiana TaxID=27376 RepID=A0ACA9KX36_9GLOM|nr:16182_t:CDS:2 [Acaulospora colombiana]